MPVLTPAELWKRSGRYDIDELFKLKDRRGAELVLAMTPRGDRHVPRRAGRALLPRPAADPLPLPDQGRDEARPRAGVLRTREFIMKDAYSFDRDARGPGRRPTSKLVERLRPRSSTASGSSGTAVESDVGMMGGIGAHEYMAPCPAGENDVALAPGYAANVEVASAEPQPVRAADGARRGELHTPGLTTIDAVAGAPRASPAGALLKAFPVVTERAGCVHGRRARRPPRQRDQARQRARRGASAPARDDELPSGSAAGFIGPVGADVADRCSTTAIVPGRPTSTGANRPDYHRVRRPAATAGERADVRTRRGRRHRRRQPDPHRARDRGRQHLQARHALLRAARRHLPRRERQGAARSGWAPTASARRASPPPRSSSTPTRRASPGRGRSRRGTSSSSALGKPGTPEREAAEALYDELRAAGLEVLYDDRDAGPGREVRRRRAARLPAAADRRPALARVRARRGAGPPRPRRPRRRRAAGGRGARRSGSCGRVSRRARRRLTLPAAVGPRPLRAAAARDAARRAAAPVDDPERDRLRPPGAASRSSSSSRSRATTGTARWPAVLFARRRLGATTPTASPRASPASTAASARCWTRSSTACWSSAASSSAGTSSCCRAGRSPSSSRASCSCSSPGATRCAAASSCEINWSGALARLAGAWPRSSSRSCGLRRLATVLLYVGLALTLMATVAVRARRPSANSRAATLKLELDRGGRGYTRARPDARRDPHGHVPRPRLALRPGAEGPHPAAHRGGDRDLLPAPDPARQDRHPARRAGQPPAQEARGRRGRHHRRRRPAADRHPRRPRGRGRRASDAE